MLPFAAEPGTVRDRRRGASKALKNAAASADPQKDVAAAGASAEPADAKGLDRKGTDLAAALEVAAAAIPPFYVPRIVLLSDGNATARRRAQGGRVAARQGRGARPSRCPAGPSPRSSSRP